MKQFLLLRAAFQLSMLRLCCGLIPVLLLASCISAKISNTELHQIKTMKPAPDQALVYVVRPEGYWGAAILFEVTCDNKLLGSTRGKNFLYVQLPPGPHRFVTTAENKSEFLLTAVAGKTYFLKQEVKMGGIYARSSWKQLESETEGRNVLGKCKLAADCVGCAGKKQ